MLVQVVTVKSKYIVENQTGMIIEVKQVWYTCKASTAMVARLKLMTPAIGRASSSTC